MERHDTLLIACGSLESRNHLRSILQGRFNLLEATNTRQMLLLLEQNLDCIASVILDISNRDVIDKDEITNEDAQKLMKQVPFVIVTDQESSHDLNLYYRYGASDVLPLNYDPYAMLHRIETIAQLTLHRKHLEAIVDAQKEDLRQFSDNMVDALSSIIEYRNMESGHHILRIRNFTQILLEEVMRHCPEYGLTPQLVIVISSASALHDVGKIGIPDAILTKPGRLTPEEWEIMKTHSVLGCDMLNRLHNTVDREYLQYAYNICRSHHERWDGKGYPDGLKEEDIPLCAQVVGLTDCYDALTSKRVYKDAYAHNKAVNMILQGECGAFSPKLLECFKNVTGRFAQLSLEYADGRDPGETIANLSLAKTPAQENTVNLVEKTRAKYYAIVHYLNAFLLEVQLDTGLFQVVYNPFPDLAQIQGARSLHDLAYIAACQIVIPEEQERMYRVIREEMPRFIQQDLRRQSFFFHHRAYGDEPSGPFEMTYLRISGRNSRPTLAILCRKIDQPRRKSFLDGSLMANFTECTYVCRNDSHFTLVRAGKDTYSLGGYTPQEVMDLFGGRLLDMAFPEDQHAIRAEFDRQLRDGPMVRTEYRFICKDGSVGWVVNKSRLVIGDDGQEYIQTFLTDITASKIAYSQMTDTLLRYQTILAQTENVLFDLDVRTMRIDLSETWEDIFGYKPSESSFSHQLSGETHVHPDDIILLKDRMAVMAAGGPDFDTVEIRIATVKGRYLWCRVRGSASRDRSGRLIRILGMIENIDSEKQAQQALEDRANRDALTQLLNKNAGKHQIERYLSQGSEPSPCALIVLDLDNFKEVNDSYGHLFGDALLTRVSKILGSLFHSQDIMARIGGDEFMILVRGITDRQLLASQCRRMRDMLLHAFQSESLDLQLGCSIGIALCPEHGSNYIDLFSKADHALYQTKANGKNNFCFYSEDAAQMSYRTAGHGITPIDSDNVSGMSTDLSHQVFRILYQAEDINQAIHQALAIMGKHAKVSRVYVFENSEDDTYCVNTFEWCNQGVVSEIKNLQHVSYVTDIPNYQDNFSEGGVFYCHDVRELPPAAYEVVAAQGIRSMLQCAIRYNGKFMGYIGFDECTKTRLWTKTEIQMLSYFSEMLSVFLIRHREQEKARIQAQKLDALASLQDGWAYILDPETYELKYADGGPRLSHLGALTGQTCYCSMGREAPCRGCPLTSLDNREVNWSLIEDGRTKSQILMEAKRIQWQGQPCCQITCRRLPGSTPRT